MGRHRESEPGYGVLMEPHVFVTLGDVTHVECDAWMLPTDKTYSVNQYWLDAVPELAEQLPTSKDERFGRGDTKATPVTGWHDTKPLPVLTAVPYHGIRTPAELEELGQAVHDFVAVGALAAPTRNANARRAKPLLAMPAFGTRGGGGQLRKGEVLQALLEAAKTASRAHDVDIVLVLRDARMFALAQQQRSQSEWPELGASLLAKARDLAIFAREGKLVPFMGAGVSVSAGGPTWNELITRLARRIEMAESEIESLVDSQRSALDQAAYLRERYREAATAGETDTSAATFGEAVQAEVTLERYGLAPALLASLGTEQAITLNYDELFENAAADAQDPRIVIPGSTPGDASGKWLLKLHGTVTDPGSIVLTRDDYLGYNATKEALSAIVKANLITHHLMFVGFGLADDHFHQIIHDVRQSLQQDEGASGYATALTMLHDPLDETLWRGQLDLIPMGEVGLAPREGGDKESIARAGRRLEIFLDALLVHATDSHSYLLHDDFETSLNDAQLSLRNKLLKLRADVTHEERSVAGWRVVERMFEELGG